MARFFDGNTDWNLNSAILTSGPFTISAWVYPTGTGNRGFVGTNTTGKIEFRVDSTQTITLLSSASHNFGNSLGTISNGVWSNVITFYDQSFGGYYINGTASGTFADGTGVNTVTFFGIGNGSGGFDVYFGRLADVAAWNVILNAGEASALAVGARPSQIRPSALQGWWPLQGFTNPEPDLSGHGNNAILNTGTAISAPDPPLMMLTPRWPQFTRVIPAAQAATTVFRRSLSPIGTRTGSRQVQGTP